MDAIGPHGDCGLQRERESKTREGPLSCAVENSVNISSNSCDHLETPKKKLSLSSPSSFSTPSTNNRRTADDSGFRFKCEDVSTEDSPYLQYRCSQCIRSDSETQRTNERSPTKPTRFGRNGQQSACKSLMKSAFTTNKLQLTDKVRPGNASLQTQQLARNLDRADRSKASELYFGIQQIPGCSPLPLSPVENASKDVASSEVNLHFDRMLLRPSAVPPSNEVNLRNDLERQENAPSPFHPQFAFSSSTPLHSHTVAFCTPTRFPEPIAVGTDSPVCLRLNFSPETTRPDSKHPETGYNDPGRGRNWFTSEQASRNLFHSDEGSLSNGNYPEAGLLSLGGLESSNSSPLLFPLTKDSPSSGFASTASSDSNPNSSVSSDSKEPLVGNYEKMEFSESESEAEDEELTTGPPEYDEFLDIESNNHLLDFDGSADEEMTGPLLWNQEQSFIGDFTKPYALPLVRSSHPDLKGISPNTVAKVIAGHYSNVINSFTIVDCRYPYEFEGGHIAGAKNIFCHEEIVNEFFPNSQLENSTKEERTILIFHCEFSSERAPKLSRFLRSKDRDLNRNDYPRLFYPEIYILEGGYKAFFQQHLELCQPQSYVSMSDRSHGDEMKQFRAKTRVFEEERGKRVLKKLCSSTKQPQLL